MGEERDSRGKIFLIPTTLGDNEPLEVLPISIKRTIEDIDYYIVENEKTARRFIKKNKFQKIAVWPTPAIIEQIH